MTLVSVASERRHPLEMLDDADRELVVRLVLASGSLKEIAASYGVSYPTIRARVDRLIERLRSLLDARPADPMAGLLGDLVERGELTISGARTIRALHRQIIEKEA